MVPTDTEIIFWFVAAIVAVVALVVGMIVGKRQSDNYIESWHADDKY